MSRAAFVGVISVAWGNASGQAILLLSSLAVARIFTPEAFGAFASLLAIIVAAGAVASVRLEAAVPAIQTHEDALSVVRAGITMSVLSGLLSVGILALSAAQLAASLSLPSSAYVWFVPVGITLVGMNTVSNQWILRHKRYRVVAGRTVINALVTSSIQIIAGLIWPTVGSLLAATVAGQAASLLLVVGNGLFVGPSRLKRAVAMLGKYRESPLILTPSTLVNTVGLQTPLLLGGYYFGAEFAGWFGMTQRFIALPITLVSMSMGQVVIGELGAMRRAGDTSLVSSFLKASAYLIALGCLVAGAVASLGPLVFEVVLGQAFAEAGEYARALSPGIAFQIVAGPMAVMLIIMGRAKVQALWDITRLLVIAGVIVAADGTGVTPVKAMAWLGLANAVLYGYQWLLSYFAVKGRPTHVTAAGV